MYLLFGKEAIGPTHGLRAFGLLLEGLVGGEKLIHMEITGPDVPTYVSFKTLRSCSVEKHVAHHHPHADHPQHPQTAWELHVRHHEAYANPKC